MVDGALLGLGEFCAGAELCFVEDKLDILGYVRLGGLVTTEVFRVS